MPTFPSKFISDAYLLFTRTSMKFEPKWYLPLNEVQFKCPEDGKCTCVYVGEDTLPYDNLSVCDTLPCL